jgi:hypothetical protein
MTYRFICKNVAGVIIAVGLLCGCAWYIEPQERALINIVKPD